MRVDKAAPPVGRVMRFRLSRRATDLSTIKRRNTLIGPMPSRALSASPIIHVETPANACMHAYACLCMSMHALMMERLAEITSYVWHSKYGVSITNSPDQIIGTVSIQLHGSMAWP